MLFLGIRRCGRLFLANRRHSLVFVAVGVYFYLIGALPRYSLCGRRFLANRSYSLVFFVEGDYS
jgi:hypothetical protein